MIQYSNIVRHDNLEFSDYLKLGGLSHSFLKSEVNGTAPIFRQTDNTKLGSMVDAILTEPGKINMLDPLYPIAKSFAAKIKETFGSMIAGFDKQVSYTADLTYQGFTISSTGRLDFLLPKRAVIDLKVTKSKNVYDLINYMGYENQLWHYCRMAEVEQKFIMIYSIPMNETYLVNMGPVDFHNEFWAQKILKFGRVSE